MSTKLRAHQFTEEWFIPNRISGQFGKIELKKKEYKVIEGRSGGFFWGGIIAGGSNYATFKPNEDSFQMDLKVSGLVVEEKGKYFLFLKAVTPTVTMPDEKGYEKLFEQLEARYKNTRIKF